VADRHVVVGAVVVDAGRVLAARRSRPDEVAGLWEFPGGKVEPGEDPRAALRRELLEELDAVVSVTEELAGSPWPISTRYVLRLYAATLVSGEPAPGADHDAVTWLRPDRLDDLDWLPADRLALDSVRAAVRDAR
jgi:8-oxo-dGTP diphosphatase